MPRRSLIAMGLMTVLAVALLVSACSDSPPNPTAPPTPVTNQAEAPGSSGVAVGGSSAAQGDAPPFEQGHSLGTPDGLPPSSEDVCDGDPAFGLCNAFCEAMDCDSANPNASQKACDRVQANYERQTGSPPPCLCPCIGGIAGWAEALDGDAVACQDLPTGDGAFVGLFLANGLVPGSQSLFINPDIGFCGFAFGTGDFLTISFDEAENCNNLVRQKAAAAGLACGP